MNLLGYWHAGARLLEIEANPPLDRDVEIWTAGHGKAESRLGLLPARQRSTFVRCPPAERLSLRCLVPDRPPYALSFDSAVKPGSIFEGKLGDLDGAVLRATAWFGGEPRSVRHQLPAGTDPAEIKGILKSTLGPATWLEVEVVPIRGQRQGPCLRQWCRRRRKVQVAFQNSAVAGAVVVEVEAADPSDLETLKLRHAVRAPCGAWSVARELAFGAAEPTARIELEQLSDGDFVAVSTSAPDLELIASLVEPPTSRPLAEPCVAVFGSRLQPRLSREAGMAEEPTEIPPSLVAELDRCGIEPARVRELKSLAHRPGLLARLAAEGALELIAEAGIACRLLETPSVLVDRFLRVRTEFGTATQAPSLLHQARPDRCFALFLDDPQQFLDPPRAAGSDLLAEAARVALCLQPGEPPWSPEQRASWRTEIEEPLGRGEWEAVRRALPAWSEVARIRILRELRLEQGDTPLARLLWIAPPQAPFTDLIEAELKSRNLPALLEDAERRGRALAAFQRMAARADHHGLAFLRLELLALLLERYDQLRTSATEAGAEAALPRLDGRDLGNAKAVLEALERRPGADRRGAP